MEMSTKGEKILSPVEFRDTRVREKGCGTRLRGSSSRWTFGNDDVSEGARSLKRRERQAALSIDGGGGGDASGKKGVLPSEWGAQEAQEPARQGRGRPAAQG